MFRGSRRCVPWQPAGAVPDLERQHIRAGKEGTAEALIPETPQEGPPLSEAA